YYGIKVYDYSSGTLSLKCNNSHGRIEGAPVIYDIDRDNEYEIIYTTSNYNCAPDESCSNKLYIINADSCTIEHSISLDISSRVGVSIADLDSDSNLEIVVNGKTGAGGSNDPHKIQVYDANTETKEWEYAGDGNLYLLYAAPNIVDIDGDGSYDIILAENTTRLLILNSSGNISQNYDLTGDIGSNPIVGDLDGDSKAEITVKRAGSPISIFAPISGANTQPYIMPIDNITALAGELIDINESGKLSAFDFDNDNLTFYYSFPFNESGLWQSTVNDTGNYSVLIEASDGELSDYIYTNLNIIDSSNNVTNTFADGKAQKSLSFADGENNTVYVRLPKNSIVTHAEIKLRGLAP
ncbi:MAG: VCBS repeat-containing protein, partial [Nanoarchaeota archaeon]